MVEKFGLAMPAVGFALKVNELIKTVSTDIFDNISYLVTFNNDNRTKAFKLADKLRKNNILAECSYFGKDRSINKEYAVNKNINCILEVESNTIKLINIKDNSENTVNIDFLLAKEAK